MNRMKRCIPVMICLLFPVSTAWSQEADYRAVLTLHTDSTCREYNRMIFGQFIEHFHRQVYGGIFDPGSELSDEYGFRKDVIQALRDLRVPVVRWPGGCFVSAYHWLGGIDQVRTPVYDKAWHVEEPNTFGTDEFVTWCRKIGAEPYICTNAGTGTSEEMSDWVEYCNLREMGKYAKMRVANGFAEPHNVKYWSIGNENYGSWELGAKTADEWGYFVRESAKLMLNVDHTIQLFAAALPDTAWTIPLLQRAGPYLKYISIHGYWDRLQEKNHPSDYLSCMRMSVLPEKRIQNTIDILKKTGYDKKIRIAFDEWNLRSWHHPGHGKHTQGQDIEARALADDNSTYTMADALFSACFLNSCLRNTEYVAMACMAPVVNTRGPLYVYPEGLVKRSTYHVLFLYANHLQPNVLPATITSDVMMVTEGNRSIPVPVVDALVTCSDDKTKMSVVLVNRHPEKQVDCTITSRKLPRSVEAFILSGDSPDAYNDINTPDRVIPVKKQVYIRNGMVIIPPHSLVILTFEQPAS